MVEFGAAARTCLASGILETKNVLQPVLASAAVVKGNAATVGIALDHGGAFSSGALCQVAPIGCNNGQIDDKNAASLCFSMPVGHYARRFMVNNEPAPRLMILPATEPSMMTFAPGSIVKLPRRCPRTCKRQFFCTIVSLTTELFISDEPVTRRRPACR